MTARGRVSWLLATLLVVSPMAASAQWLMVPMDRVPADSNLSSYTLGRASRFAIVYTSTMGLELAAAGIPVVVAGDTHYRGLGFTHDVVERAGYTPLIQRLLDETPAPPDREQALRYAHFFFFEFMIPLPLTREIENKHVRIPLAALDELAPGRHPAVDAVADGLLEGRPIYLSRS